VTIPYAVMAMRPGKSIPWSPNGRPMASDPVPYTMFTAWAMTVEMPRVRMTGAKNPSVPATRRISNRCTAAPTAAITTSASSSDTTSGRCSFAVKV
jgi:hypothetical protein